MIKKKNSTKDFNLTSPLRVHFRNINKNNHDLRVLKLQNSRFEPSQLFLGQMGQKTKKEIG